MKKATGPLISDAMILRQVLVLYIGVPYVSGSGGITEIRATCS